MSDVSMLQRCLSEWRVRSGASGVSEAVRLNGRLHWTSTSETEGVFDAVAQFPIYSITKTLTAICLLRLHETGLLELSDPVRKWLPDLALSEDITIVHLLRHTSGLPDYGPLSEYHEAVRLQPSRPWPEQRFLQVVLSRGMLFAPGAGWAYSNIGYMLLLKVSQHASGQSFAQLLRELVITPLELRRTSVLERIEDWSTCVPGLGSEVDIDGRVVDVRGIYHPGWCAPGVAASNAEETAFIFDALLAGKVLKPDTLADMLTLVSVPGHHPPAIAPSCGMGILSDAGSPRGRNFGHGGGGPGYDLNVTVFTDTPLGRLTVATFVNMSCGPRARDCEAALVSELLDAAA